MVGARQNKRETTRGLSGRGVNVTNKMADATSRQRRRENFIQLLMETRVSALLLLG